MVRGSGAQGESPTHQLQVLCRLLVQVVSQVLIEASQVLHLHLDPILAQVVMALELIPTIDFFGDYRGLDTTD